MSYKITVYCDDSTIKKTSYTVSQAGSYSGTYGSSALGPEKEFTNSGFGDSWTAKFTAEPAAGCSFVKWEYWRGTKEGNPYSSTSATFTYSGGQDLFIRAVGKRDSVDTPWKPWSSFSLDSIDTVSESAYLFYYDPDGEEVNGIGEYQIHRGRVTFARSGLAHFSSNSNINVVGYLSDSPEHSFDWSEPASILAYDDDGGNSNNFDIEYEVEADTEYYLFVRGATGTETGFVEVVVTEPWNLNSVPYDTLYGAHTESIYTPAFTLCRRKVSFPKSGTVTVYAESEIDTEGWVTQSDEWDRGTPVLSGDHYYDDDGTGNSDFQITFEVEAWQDYYLWFRSVFNTTAYISLNVSGVEEKEVAVEKWSWTSSNGTALKSETEASYNAVVNKEETINFSHYVWNDMARKVKEIRSALGLDWNEYYATFDETLMTEADADGYYELSAEMFNSLRYNIGSVYAGGSGINEVASGADVYGWYFTTLASRMNDWIDTL